MSDETTRTDEVEAHGFGTSGPRGSTVSGTGVSDVEGNTVSAQDEEPDVEAHGFGVSGPEGTGVSGTTVSGTGVSGNVL